MKPIFRRSVLRLLAVGLLAAAVAPAAALAQSKKVLVVTVTTGFRHSSIETAEKIIAKLAAESGDFTVDFVRQPAGQPAAPAKPKVGAGGEADPAHQAALVKYQAADAAYKIAQTAWLAKVAVALEKLSPASLKGYDGVIFANTTGDLPLPDKQAFLDWIKAGHGFVGLHSATDTFHGFPAFIEMIGGEFKTHGAQSEVECLNQDPQHAASKHLPAAWTVFDEIYQFKSFDRSTVHGILGLNKHPNDKSPGDYPVAWCKEAGRGRVFYTSLGHREDLWDLDTPANMKRINSPERTRAYQQHVLGGIRWALGLAEGDAKPQPVKLD